MGTSANAERREANRRRFNGTVELSLPDDAESYEADAIDLSIGGMSLKTAYLPDVGSELDCRIRLEDDETRTVQARGRVVWARDGEKDLGSFGLRFTELARGDLAAIGKLCDQADTRGSEGPALLRLPRLPDPVNASVETQREGELVLGMGLSFIKFGEPVEVERAGEVLRGAIERVEIAVDPTSRAPRLLATVVLDAATTPRTTAVARKTRGSDAPPAKKSVAAHAPEANEAEPVRAASERPSARPLRGETAARMPETQAPAHGTEVLSSSEGAARADRASPDASDDGSTPSLASDSSTPAWLVSALAKVRAGGRGVVERAAPAAKKAFATLVTLAVAWSAKVRAKLTGKPVELPAATPTVPAKTTAKTPSENPKPSLRKQHPTPVEPATASSTATESSAPGMRRKYAFVGLGVFGLSAITFALATGGRERRVEPPRPQVAVESAAATSAGAATGTPAATPETGTPAASQATGTPTAIGTSAPETETATTEPDPSTPTANPAPAATTPGGARMPSDLVAAARSRNANVDAERPTVRRDVPAVTLGPRATPTVTPRSVAAAAVATAVRPLGSPSIRSGTVLRLRFDGPITSLTGGAAGRDSLSFRVDGRRVIDRAASFVRMDARIAGAGAYNRGNAAEFTLRFQGAAPAYSARARGEVLEVILAPPAANNVRIAAAPRPAAPGARIASMPRR
jgi:hypothetical protein